MNLIVCGSKKFQHLCLCLYYDANCMEVMPAQRTCYHSMFPSVFILSHMHNCFSSCCQKCDNEKNVAVKTVLLNTDKLNCHICDEILEGLETIDDECDVYGIHLVKIQDPQLAKRYSIKTFPALVYFRNGNPLLYEGKLCLSIAGANLFILLM